MKSACRGLTFVRLKMTRRVFSDCYELKLHTNKHINSNGKAARYTKHRFFLAGTNFLKAENSE